jgi:biopolymer transport protein TolR
MLKRQRRLCGLNKLNSDINVVPYIDVMLVLLVIFMITAPLLTQGIHVALPSAKGSDVSTQQTPIILSVDQQGQYFLNINKVPSSAITPQQLLSEVSARLSQKTKKPPEVIVKGDKNVPYGKVVLAMGLLKKAGADNVGLITQAPPEKVTS